MGVSNGEQQGRVIACGRRCVAYRPNSRPLWRFVHKKRPTHTPRRVHGRRPRREHHSRRSNGWAWV